MSHQPKNIASVIKRAALFPFARCETFWLVASVSLFIFIFYRLRLYWELTHTDSRTVIFEFSKNPPPLTFVIGDSHTDFYVSAIVGLVAQLLLGLVLLFGRASKKGSQALRHLLYGMFGITFLALAALSATNHRLLLETVLGVWVYLVSYFFTSMLADPNQVTREVMSWTSTPDLLFILLSPTAGYVMYRFLSTRKTAYRGAVLFAAAVSFACDEYQESYYDWYDEQLETLGDKFDIAANYDWREGGIQDNPVLQVADVLYWYMTRERTELEKSERPPSESQMRSVGLVDPLFVAPHGATLGEDLRAAVSKRPIRSVINFVIESGSAENMIERGAEVMPFTSELMTRSISSRDHFTTMGVTIQAVASMFTGLYSSAYNFDKPGWNFPTLFSFLQDSGRDYKLFWVTSGSFRGFFPADLLRRNNSLQVWDMITLPQTRAAGQETFIRNELDAFDFFLKTLDDNPGDKPVGATYYYYATHYPYYTFGPKEEFLIQDTTRSLNRYLNALHLADKLIRRLVEHLEKTGKLEETLIVITGDHGEGFGDEPFHGTQTTNNVLKTPLIIFNPGLPARAISQPTSHVDILPTTLDALGIDYSPELFHGESLLRSELKRRFVMAANYYSDTAFIDSAGRKVVLKYLFGGCEEYEPGNDADAKPCDTESAAYQAGLSYRRYVNTIIPTYNAALKEGVTFEGKSHPTLGRFAKKAAPEDRS